MGLEAGVPNQLGFDRLDHRLDHRIVITVQEEVGAGQRLLLVPSPHRLLQRAGGEPPVDFGEVTFRRVGYVLLKSTGEEFFDLFQYISR